MIDYGSAGKAALAYRKQEVESADPLALVVHVFEEASRNLAQARAALSEGNAAVKGERIHQVARCLMALQSALDMERGEDVAKNLDRLYGYLQRRLTEGHLRNDDEILGEVARHLVELGSAWESVSRGHEPATAAAAR